MRYTTRIALALLAWGTSAFATTYYVDGGCASSGDGTTLTCGASGPFKTIGEGVEAMSAGDTLNIRGDHATHGTCAGTNGQYKEYLGLWLGSPNGKPLLCTSGSPCVIQGCAAAQCGSDETAIITGLVQQTDWVGVVGCDTTVYQRTMEQRTEYIGGDKPRDEYDPTMLCYGASLTTCMPVRYYATSPANPCTIPDNYWAYNSSTHVVYVNPLGTTNPNTTFWVPDQRGIITVQGAIDTGNGGPASNGPSQYVTFRRLALHGSRWMGLLLWPSEGGGHRAAMNLDLITVRSIPRFFINPYRNRDFTWENITMDSGCRGLSFNRDGMGGCFGLRAANSNDTGGSGTLRNITATHLGSAGDQQGTNEQTDGIDCLHCDSPWNVKMVADGGSRISANGNAMDLKWTTNITASTITISDISFSAIHMENLMTGTVEDFDIRRARIGVSTKDLDSGTYTHYANNVIRNGFIDTAGWYDIGAVWLQNNTALGLGEFGVKVYNLRISRPGWAGIDVQNVDKVSLWNNTIQGDHPFRHLYGGGLNNDGIRFSGTATNVEMRNNIISDVVLDGLDMSTATAGGDPVPVVDYNLYHSNDACAVRWAGTCYASLAAFQAAYPAYEINGLEADPLFVDTAADPPDLHLQAGSPAIDAGVDLSAHFTTDYDGDTR